MLPFAEIPLVDHHCHSLLVDQPRTVEAYRACFTESPDGEVPRHHVAHTVFYRRAIRDLAEFFGCAADEEAVLEARSRMPFSELVRECFAAANVAAALVDYGFRPRDHYAPGALAALLPCRTAPVLRLEALLQELLPAAPSLASLQDAFVAAIEEAPREGVVAFKTIIAYRSGLAVERHSPEALEAAFQAERAQAGSGPHRVTAKPLLDAMLWLALERIAPLELPVQVHAGFGDPDLHLVYANPAWLRPVFEYPAFRRVRFVLLHSYPYVAEAAWLASVYAHVYVDLSLAVPFLAHGATQALVDALAHAPLTKVLYASDAFSIPELFWLGGLHGRRALDRALRRIAAEGFLAEEEIPEAAGRILGGNARDLYSLERANRAEDGPTS
ncbi:MAG: amidohydrolase family protein [Armatimonadota bacterium]|nr:amidohydrolase family protein [Armatimonadota bacterium]MDR7538926.1 amidohydrolase family protein [Armatimonadota bacterium]